MLVVKGAGDGARVPQEDEPQGREPQEGEPQEEPEADAGMRVEGGIGDGEGLTAGHFEYHDAVVTCVQGVCLCVCVCWALRCKRFAHVPTKHPCVCMSNVGVHEACEQRRCT